MNHLTHDSLIHDYQENPNQKNSPETEDHPSRAFPAKSKRGSSFISIPGNTFKDPLKQLPYSKKFSAENLEPPLKKATSLALSRISKSDPHLHTSNCVELYSKTFRPESPTIIYLKSDESYQRKLYQEKNFVTETMVTRWNSQIGNSKNPETAKNLIIRMRQLAGLEPSYPQMETNIAEARLGLCLLAGYHDQDCKMLALNSLLEILTNDRGKEEESNRLVEMAINLLELLGKEKFQTYGIKAQVKFAEIYCALTEVLNVHYSKKHLNAITTELKRELLKAAESIKLLNRQENHKIKFYANCAQEGIRRFKDDKQELFILLGRLYHSAAGAISLYRNDAREGFGHLEKAFIGINGLSKSNTWYDAIMVAKNMTHVIKDGEDLTILLQMIGKKHHEKTNWKFLYAAVQILFQIALHGNDPHIRLRAFNGVKAFGQDCPGLAFFADIDDLKQYTSYKNIKHLKKPEEVDPNVRIRRATVECLIELLKNAPDREIRTKAEKILRIRAKKETDPEILEIIEMALSSIRNTKII